MPKIEFATLAHTYTAQHVIGWGMSRKFNGHSCLWDGGVTRGKLCSDVPWYYRGKDKPGIISTGLWSLGRNDKPKPVFAPDSWLDGLPVSVPLHGELWKDDDLEFIKSTCTQGEKGRHDDRWEQVEYLVYGSKPYCRWEGISDVWSFDFDSTFFNNRPWSVVREDLLRVPGNFRLVDEIKVVSLTQVQKWQDEALQSGWEGLMFKNPAAQYEPWRSHNLLKWKPEFDTEGTVVGYEDGKTGKNIGKAAGPIVKIKWDEKILTITGGRAEMIGREVTCCVSGWTDSEREWGVMQVNFPLGSEVAFTFKCVSNHGVPQSPNYKR